MPRGKIDLPVEGSSRLEFSLLRSRSSVCSVFVDLGAGEEGGIETEGGAAVLPLPAVDSCLADRSVIGFPETLA